MNFMTEDFWNRLLEILPGALTWVVLTSPLWLSIKLPFAAAVLVLFLNTYWVFRALKMAFYSYVGYFRMQKALKIDWISELDWLKRDEKSDWHHICHLLVIPTLKEPITILEQCLKSIEMQEYPKERIFVLVGLEEKEGAEELKRKQRELEEKFKAVFGGLFFTIHPKNYPGHMPGAGSNRTYAVKVILPILKDKVSGFNQVILTTLDADFVIHKKFLAGMTYKYLTTEKREKRTFTGVFWYFNNFWQSPFFTRMVASGVSFWQLSEMAGSDKYMNFSSHSINLQSLIEMDFWVVNKVNDDGEFYWRAYYHFSGDYAVIPHYLPIFADCVQNKNVWLTIKEQYLQLKRWAYGVEHMPMIIKNYFKRSDIPFFGRTDRVLFLIRSYLTWSTLAVLVTFGGIAVQVINPNFAMTTLAFNLPYFTSRLLAMAILGLLSLIFLQEKLVPPRPKKWGIFTRIFSFIQWIFLPLTLLFYGSLPAIDAQTRLMLGKYMEFRVTTKVRS